MTFHLPNPVIHHFLLYLCLNVLLGRVEHDKIGPHRVRPAKQAVGKQETEGRQD